MKGDKYDKAQKILDEGLILYRGIKGNRFHFIVKGEKQAYYNVYRETRKPKYNCECDNACFSQEECAHIIAASRVAVSRRLI